MADVILRDNVPMGTIKQKDMVTLFRAGQNGGRRLVSLLQSSSWRGVRVAQWYRRRTEIVKFTGSNLTGAPNSEKKSNRGIGFPP